MFSGAMPNVGNLLHDIGACALILSTDALFACFFCVTRCPWIDVFETDRWRRMRRDIVAQLCDCLL